jgi:hypothetical protein
VVTTIGKAGYDSLPVIDHCAQQLAAARGSAENRPCSHLPGRIAARLFYVL